MSKEVDYEIENDFGDDHEEDGAEAAAGKMAEEASKESSKESSRAVNSVGGAIAEGITSATDAAKEKWGKQDVNELKDISGLKELFNKVEPLSKTEQLMLKGLRTAVDSGDIKAVQEMLATLAENPKAVDRVLGALKAEMQKRDGLTNVGWEQGKDNNGNPFVRMRIYQRDDYSKSSGGTEVTVGSDGRNSASYQKRWDSQPSTLDPAAALQSVTNRKVVPDFQPRPDRTEWQNYKLRK